MQGLLLVLVSVLYISSFASASSLGKSLLYQFPLSKDVFLFNILGSKLLAAMIGHFSENHINLY